MERKIHEIATEICSKWTKVYFGAEPYLAVMQTLNTIDDMYFEDSAKEIILYFLSNASTWRGEDARRIKQELKSII
jgi:hypothetical protein